MQIVIMCGGLATRLKKLSENTPKSMIKIKGKPFLEYQIDQLKKYDVTDVVLCVGHLSEQIKDYFGNGSEFDIKIKYSHDGDKPLGPIGSIKNAENLLEDVFFTLYGDSYVFVDYQNLYKDFTDEKNLAMMTVFQNFDKYDKSNIIVEGNHIIKYNREKTSDMTYIDYGVSIFRKKILNIIPKNSFYSTKDLYTKLIDKNELLAYKIDNRFYHIGNPEALEEFKKYIESKK